MAINKDWHLANRMPHNPTEQQRALWHLEHAEHCGCRTPSDKEKALMDKYHPGAAGPSATPQTVRKPSL